MKVAIFGSNGMAGHTIAKYLDQWTDIQVTRIARSDADIICDVEYQQMVASTMLKLEDYDYIVNCIGLLVKDSIERPDRAAILNAWWPNYLQWWASRRNCRIIHLSTDCVFDGSKGRYKEDDPHTETNAYGKSKSLGEINNYKDITFRTSIIGTELKSTGSGLLQWVISNQNSTIDGYVDAWWNGVTTLQLAKCIHNWMQQPTVTGVYHLVDNSVNINKYDLVNLINEVWRCHKFINPINAPKAVNKILVDTRQSCDWGIPNYETQLVELYKFSRT